MATKAQDTFTEASNTDLDAHTPDVGTGWVADSGFFVDGTYDVCGFSQGGNYNPGWARETTDIGADAMDVTCDCNNTSTLDTRAEGPAGRMASGSGNANNYTAFIQGDSLIKLQKRVASVNTEIGSYTDSVNDRTLKLEIRTATKKVFADAVERISSSDDNLTGNQFAGIYGVRENSHMDNFLSESVVTGPTVAQTLPAWEALTRTSEVAC